VLLILSYLAFTVEKYREEWATLGSFVLNARSIEPPSVRETNGASPEAPVSRNQPVNQAVFPLDVKKIVLDPGHGGDHFGAVAPVGIAEKEVTLDVALRLRRLLEEASFEVLLTRKRDEAVTLAQRASFANSAGADIFVSIHVNWIETRQVRSVETYFLGPTDDPAAVRLAGIENRESGYSLADYRRLLEKVYIDARRDQSRNLAETIQRELLSSLGQVNPSLKSGGVKRAPFVVLVATDMPAVLVEVSCLSNEQEAERLADTNYRQEIARALFKGIRSYTDNLNGSSKKRS
jgi:N-acetylmuramoyl-L-alanine amidase